VPVRRTRPQIVAELTSLARRRKTLSARELLPEHRALIVDAMHVFGNFAAARKAAGMQPTPIAEGQRALLTALAELSAGWRARLTGRVLEQLGEHELLAAAEARYGSLQRARSEAGITVGRVGEPLAPKVLRRQTAADAALELVKATALRLGRTPKILELPRPVYQTLLNQYGWYTTACEAAGLKPLGRRRPFTPRKLPPVLIPPEAPARKRAPKTAR
jgi:hypothetical protein